MAMDVLGTVIASTALAIVFVGLRLFIRLFWVGNPGKDDIFLVASLLSSCVLNGCELASHKLGLGNPKFHSGYHDIEKRFFLIWLAFPFYSLSLTFTKLSALFFYIRIFRTRPFFIAAYILMGFLIVSGTWMVFSGFFSCVPISDAWNVKKAALHQTNCLPRGPNWYAISGMQLLSDVFIILLPMPFLSKLKLPRQKKAGLIMVFALGLFVIVTSSIRLYEVSITLRKEQDSAVLAKASNSAVWSSIEVNVAVICACLPSFYLPIARVLSSCFHTSGFTTLSSTGRTASIGTGTGTVRSSIHDHGTKGSVLSNKCSFTGESNPKPSINNGMDHHRPSDGTIQVKHEIGMISSSGLEQGPTQDSQAYGEK